MNLHLFFYPTTLVWVDDDIHLLNSSTQWLGGSRSLETFSSPERCLQFFKNYQPVLPKADFLKVDENSEVYDLMTHQLVDLNSAALQQHRMSAEKSKEVAVMIVDYKMPGMNGLELCQQLAHVPCKKILLTGEADHSKAIKAFNNGVIDCFLRKDGPFFIREMEMHLQNQTEKYFREQTAQLRMHLETQYPLHLSDPEFVGFFKTYCESQGICEHYIIDSKGDFLLVDKMGQKFYFVVHNNRSLNMLTEMYADVSFATPYLNAIRAREQIPFYGEGVDSLNMREETWRKCFHPAQAFKGRETYWWTLIKA